MQISITITDLLIALCAGASLVFCSAAAGFWAGRKSVGALSVNTGAGRAGQAIQDALKTASGEPDGGDIYADAAYGTDNKPVSTIPTERGD